MVCQFSTIAITTCLLVVLLSSTYGSGFSGSSSDPDSTGSDKRGTTLTIGAVLPHSWYLLRTYQKVLRFPMLDYKKNRTVVYNFPNFFPKINYELVPMPLNPSPTGILNALCEKFLSKNVTAILYLSNMEVYGMNTASSQYLLQLTGYLGIPVIAWNADNSGLVQDQKRSNSIILQMAPSIEHQTAAMLRILQRYTWHQFSIVTSQIAGFNEFSQAVRDAILSMQSEFRLSIISTITLDSEDYEKVVEQLSDLLNTETRIILLYSTQAEATTILQAAGSLGLTGKDFVWVVTQSIIGDLQQDLVQTAPYTFPPGMLGVHFDISFTTLTTSSLYKQVDKAYRVLANGLELFVNDPRNANVSLVPNLSCLGQGESRWNKGEHWYRYLRNVSISLGEGQPLLEFNTDGSLKYAELEVVNLNEQLKWDKIGKWANNILDIKDIVWPGNSHVPPQGVPEKFHLKAVFLEEAPFVKLEDPDPVSGKCINHGVSCRIAKESELAGVNMSMATRNTSFFKCCSGFTVDLMELLAEDLGFTYEMFRVEDGYWGTEVNKKWNGLIGAIINRKADLVMTSITINAEREAVVDFSVPFMDTGIALVVARRTGIISPKAFLEPFDTVSWLLILLVSIQVAALAIFSFEWCSPSGYDRKIQPPRDHKFSLFRTYWLVWAILFGASVSVDCPRGYTARYMSSIWAMFAVVFLAIYTANLAAFMITREEFYNLQGIEDERLTNPHSMKPPLRFATTPFGNSESILMKNYPNMYKYMKPFTRATLEEGVNAVKDGGLEAFVYDATALTYLVGTDPKCELLTVGSWYAMSGYGFAFPKYSKHLEPFNRYLIGYRDNGDLERLQRFWLTVGCKPKKKDRTLSNPLSLDQFMSAFLLLLCGILLAFMLLGLEHVYFTYLRKHLAKTDTGGCCALISLSMGKSLSFRGAVFEAQDVMKKHKCRDPLCDLHLWKVKHQLDMAQLYIERLEKELRVKGVVVVGGGGSGERTSDRIRPALTPGIGTVLNPYDMTRNHVSTNEPVGLLGRYQEGYFYEPVSTKEVSEIETVL